MNFQQFDMFIDIVEIWSLIADGQISNFDSYLPTTQ